MRIAKEFRWEMGHRLPFHDGKCKNLHGHSYKLSVEITGDTDKNGMVMDYFDLKKVVQPIVEELDHGFMVNEEDKELLMILQKLSSKHIRVNFETTAENICRYFLDKISRTGLPSNIKALKVRVFESETSYAEEEKEL